MSLTWDEDLTTDEKKKAMEELRKGLYSENGTRYKEEKNYSKIIDELLKKTKGPLSKTPPEETA